MDEIRKRGYHEISVVVQNLLCCGMLYRVNYTHFSALKVELFLIMQLQLIKSEMGKLVVELATIIYRRRNDSKVIKLFVEEDKDNSDLFHLQ